MNQQSVSYLGPLTKNPEPDEADDRSRSDGSKSSADSSGFLLAARQSSGYIIQGIQSEPGGGEKWVSFTSSELWITPLVVSK